LPITDYAAFVRVLAEDIVPLLEEYCYEDYKALARVLGSGMVDVATQRIRSELFAHARRDELVQALLEPAADVLTSAEAVTDELEEPESEVTET
jgi:5-methylcytosine-specific restriction protein B